jgi:hypothetical protein
MYIKTSRAPTIPVSVRYQGKEIKSDLDPDSPLDGRIASLCEQFAAPGNPNCYCLLLANVPIKQDVSLKWISTK